MSKRRQYVRPTKDKNFDEIADRFSEGIYGNLKGQIRLEVLQRDFDESGLLMDGGPDLKVLDAGGGSGQFSCRLSQKGHEITLADPSRNMLDKARSHYAAKNSSAHVQFLHSSVQELPIELEGTYDLILFHAVLEWLIEPEKTLEFLLRFLKPDGQLSLLFYNKQGLIMRHLTLGNFHFVEKGYLSGVGEKSLTPISPLISTDVLSWFERWGYKLQCHSGVRCFYDFMDEDEKAKLKGEDVVRLELLHSQQDPYREIARYIHVLLQKPL